MKWRWETPRYLGSTGGYTSDPRQALGQTSAHPTTPDNLLGGQEIRDVPEHAVPADVQKWITADANQAHAVRGSATQAEVLQGERTHLDNVLAQHEEAARAKGLNVSSDVRVVRRRLEALDQKLGRL